MPSGRWHRHTQLRVLEKNTSIFVSCRLPDQFVAVWCRGPLKCLVSCLGFLLHEETKRIGSVQKVWSCHVSVLDSCFGHAVTFISVGVVPTGSKVALTGPVLNTTTHK